MSEVRWDAVSDKPCDGYPNKGCGATPTRHYIDGHVFRLCAECAWLLTDAYKKVGLSAPWQTETGMAEFLDADQSQDLDSAA